MSRRARITPENAENTFTSLRSLMTSVTEPPDLAESQAVELELARIRPNPDQPRQRSSSGFSKASIDELAQNIRERGVLQPILVKDTGRFYQIVAGERRYRACQLIGMERIPARIVEPRDEQDELMISLAENLQRRNLGPMDEAQSFHSLIQRFGLSYRDLARLSGRSVAHIHGRLQLLQHDDVRRAVEQKLIGIADAIQLARIPDEASRKELLAEVQEGSLKGAALHRRVQVFLGELSPEAAEAAERGDVQPSGPGRLRGALAAVEALPVELPDDDLRVLYTIAAHAAERLHLRLVAASLRTPASGPTEQPEEPQVAPAEARRVIARVKDHRDGRGHTTVNRIRVFWMTVERRGYQFAPGEWRANALGDGGYLVSFNYTIDGEERRMEWWHQADGSVQPANQDAAALYE